MPIQLKELGEGPSSKPQVELIPPNVMPVAPYNGKRQNTRRNQEVQEVNKAMENNAGEEMLPAANVKPPKKWRFYCTHAMGTPLAWIPMFSMFGLGDEFKEETNSDEESKPPLRYKNNNPFACPEPQKKLESWRARFSSKKDQATQTYTLGEPCPLCMREEARRTYGLINLGPFPSVVDPASCNKYTREAAIECPDTTYYDSSQLTFYRAGNYAYRGWTYMTPDGRIEHMPRVLRPIPIDELRVDKPLRSPAPQ